MEPVYMFKCAAALENSLAALLKTGTVKNRINWAHNSTKCIPKTTENMSLTVKLLLMAYSSSIIHSSLKGAITLITHQLMEAQTKTWSVHGTVIW